MQFLDSFTWGPIRTADATIAGQTVHAVPIQVIGDPGFASPPDGCTASGLPPADTAQRRRRACKRRSARPNVDVEITVSFDVENAQTLFANDEAFAYDDLGGPGPNMFDWGLPFFFGRRVLIAIEGQSTPAGPGPYLAY